MAIIVSEMPRKAAGVSGMNAGLFLWRLRHWNRRFSELYDELRKEIGND